MHLLLEYSFMKLWLEQLSFLCSLRTSGAPGWECANKSVHASSHVRFGFTIPQKRCLVVHPPMHSQKVAVFLSTSDIFLLHLSLPRNGPHGVQSPVFLMYKHLTYLSERKFSSFSSSVSFSTSPCKVCRIPTRNTSPHPIAAALQHTVALLSIFPRRFHRFILCSFLLSLRTASAFRTRSRVSVHICSCRPRPSGMPTDPGGFPPFRNRNVHPRVSGSNRITDPMGSGLDRAIRPIQGRPNGRLAPGETGPAARNAVHWLPVLRWRIWGSEAGGNHARTPGCRLGWTWPDGLSCWIHPSSKIHASNRARAHAGLFHTRLAVRRSASGCSSATASWTSCHLPSSLCHGAVAVRWMATGVGTWCGEQRQSLHAAVIATHNCDGPGVQLARQLSSSGGIDTGERGQKLASHESALRLMRNGAGSKVNGGTHGHCEWGCDECMDRAHQALTRRPAGDQLLVRGVRSRCTCRFRPRGFHLVCSSHASTVATPLQSPTV